MRERNSYRIIIQRILALLIVGVLYVTHAYGNSKQFRFTNNTGQAADDMHINFSRSVTFPNNPADPGTPLQNPPGSFKEASGSGSSRVHLAAGLTGTGVAAGGSIVLTFSWPSGSTPKIRSAFWTKGNTLTPANADYLRPAMKPENQNRNSWVSLPATGDGYYLVTLDGQSFEFFTVAGETAAQTAARFADLINSMTFGTVLDLTESSIDYRAEIYGEGTVLTVDILNQDSTQTMSIESLIADPIPTLGQWGVIIFTLLLLTFGAVFIRKNQMQLAGMPNGTSDHSSQQPWYALMLEKNFPKTLLVMVVLLSLIIFLVYGTVTSLDIGGILLSAIILSYLWNFLNIK